MKKPFPKAKKISAKILKCIAGIRFDESNADSSTWHRILKKPLPPWEYDFNKLPNDKEKRTPEENNWIRKVVFHEYGREDWRSYQHHLREHCAVPSREMDRIKGSASPKSELNLKPFQDMMIMRAPDGMGGGFEYMKSIQEEIDAQLPSPPSFSYHAVSIDWTRTKEEIVASFTEWMEDQPGSKFPRLGKSTCSLLNSQLDWLVAWRGRRAGYTYDEFRMLRPRKAYADKYVYHQACSKAEKIITAIAQGVPLKRLLGLVERD